MARQIDPRWEFDCKQVDFHSPVDPDADDWFDVDRENEPPLHQRNNRTALEQLKHAYPSIKSPLKDLNVEFSSRSSKPATDSSRSSMGSLFRKKSPENTRNFHFKTKMTAGRRTELKRKSVDASHYLSTISLCSKTSQSSKTTENEDKGKGFEQSLRKYDTPDQAKKSANRCTIPVPFSFESRTVEKKTPVAEFKSFAQQVISYQNKTPLRFRMKPKIERVDSPTSSIDSRQSVKKTCVPRSPSLQTKNRTRPSAVQSQEEIEEQEYRRMKTYKFQAQPFKDEIYKKGYQDLPEKRVKNRTVVRSFSLHVNAPRKAPKLETFKFHAKPLNREIFERPLGIPNVPKISAVTAEPFSFAELDRERQRKTEQKIKEFWEERKRLREFQARPLPDLGVVKGVPEKQPKPKTVIKPFDFLKSDRELHTLEKKRIAEEMQRLNEPVVFKAKPMLNVSPFVPQKPNRYITCDAAPNLHLDKRAEERRAFERHLSEKEERRKQEEEKRRRMMEALEEEEQKRIRSNAVHKAEPIRQYPALSRPPSKELTEPVTPKCLRKK